MSLSALETRVIESVLEMGGGYVLDFSDRTFSAFFSDFGVPIDDQSYRLDGGSKARRFRQFLRQSSPPLTGKVLAALLQHRLQFKPDGLRPTDVEVFRKAAVRLGASTVEVRDPGARADPESEDELLKRVFRREAFVALPMEGALCQLLIDRMDEARRCIDANAPLAAVILCGSVLEGMCLGTGSRNAELCNRAFTAQYNKPSPPFHEWRLAQWIEVLARIGHLSPNVQKFGHALRDFRNYVHPAEQLANRFGPDAHTARIGFQVVVAAAEDLVRAQARNR